MSISNFENSNKLRLKLLGAIEVKLGDIVIASFGSRKAQALLFYLAIIDGGCTRDTAAALLWPDMPDKKAKSNLRVTLAKLKQQLGSHVDISTTKLSLNRQLPYESDVETFRKRLATSLHQRDLKESEAAIALYKGEFLQGFHLHNAAPFEEWVIQQREHLRMLAIQGLESLVNDCLEQKAYAAGLNAARQLLQLEPWHENAHRQVMLLLALSNQRVAALNHFELCRRQLQNELGVDPSPDTVALYERIKAGEYEQSGKATVQPTTAHPPQPTPHNLASPLTDFVGRTAELAFIQQQFGEYACRLLTILGPGGMGKSSLAQQAARLLLQLQGDQFPHGIFIVSLLGIDSSTDPAEAGDAILMAMAEATGGDLRGGAPYLTQLIAHLRQSQLLLILDNMEHLIAGAQHIAELLAQAPHVRMIVTSRTRLRIKGETTLVLGKLSLPSAPIPLGLLNAAANAGVDLEPAQQNSEAVAMFVQRARAMDPRFTVDQETLAAIVHICVLVDGLPLGIELAVSWLHALTCVQIEREIERDLDFLTTDLLNLPPAQRALRTVFERSWGLLESAEQITLAKLAIFPATFQPEAAQFVANAPLSSLAKLVNHSLLLVNSSGAYFMHRSVREFALAKLSAQPEQFVELQKRYARFYLDFIVQREHNIKGIQYATAIEQLTLQLDNIRTAWEYAITYEMFDELHTSHEGLALYYEGRGYYKEGVDRFNRAIRAAETRAKQANETAPNNLYENVWLLTGQLYAAVGWYYARLGQGAEAEQALQSSLTILQNRERSAADAIAPALLNWGLVVSSYAPQRALTMLGKCIAPLTRTGDRWRLPIAWTALAGTHWLMGNYHTADICCREGERLAQKHGGPYGMELALQMLGRIAIARGRYHLAAEYLQASFEFAQRGALKPQLTMALYWQGESCRLCGQMEQAQLYYKRSIDLAKTIGHTMAHASALWGQGCLAEGQGNYVAAKEYFLHSQALTAGGQWIHLQPQLGWALLGLGEVAQARQYFTDVASRAAANSIIPALLDAQLGLAYIEHSQGSSPALQKVMQTVREHRSSTEETRSRINKIASKIENPKTAAVYST
ncbi:MAG: AAA family ATPase [Caldilineaceae bacterium]|nr:AAA family ATPase [Caldilineaceae bacterium]